VLSPDCKFIGERRISSAALNDGWKTAQRVCVNPATGSISRILQGNGAMGNVPTAIDKPRIALEGAPTEVVRKPGDGRAVRKLATGLLHGLAIPIVGGTCGTGSMAVQLAFSTTVEDDRQRPDRGELADALCPVYATNLTRRA
jgi:hypothetical protein